MVQGHEAPRIEIGDCGTGIERGTVNRARSLPKVDDRIEFPLSPYVQRAASEIRPRGDPVLSDLSLNCQIPGMLRRGLSIRIHHEVVTARIKLRIVIFAGDVRLREGLPTGIVLPGIVKTANWETKGDAGSPRRGPVAGVQRSRYHVVPDRVGTANRHTAISVGIPSKSQVRRDIVPPVFHAFPLADSRVAATGARETGVARIGQ